MKISLGWLNDYVDVSEFFKAPKDLAAKLTAAGLEVESVTDLSRQFGHVVTGKIVELGKHPKADRLTLCQVDAGEGSLRQIVCGATNHRQNDHVVVALPGAILPGDFQIKDSKIRDVESRGMLCSESELGLKSESEGILILPSDAPIGVPFARYFGLEDIVIEINVTPNRADCLSHLGLAREIGCLLGRKVKVPKVHVKGSAAFTKKTIEVDLKDGEQCPRYCGRSMRGVKVGPSPDWLKQRLRAVDINSINNVVDVTNYVMMELGQPLHAFDVRFLKVVKL
jgi:phenylalanyl-tRNA synthetase beta chain